VNAVQLQTYRTLLTVESSFQSLLAGFTDFFFSLQYHYRTFLEEHIRKIEKHCQNVKDEQCFQRLRLLNTEKPSWMTYRQKEGTIPQMNCSASSKIFTSKKT